MPSDSKKVSALEGIFQIKMTDKKLFEKALTHGSYTKENEITSLSNYERLEFLGDAVLKLCVSDILYKKYPKYMEGELTKIRSIIVSDSTLAEIAQKIGLSPLMILGKHAEKLGGRSRKSILACTFEAILGAYFIEGKFAEVSAYLTEILEDFIVAVDDNFEKFNAKAILQEYTQSQTKMTPVYRITEEQGPSHNKTFLVEVSYLGEVLACAEGKTKKEAEQKCAHQACEKLGVIK
jgi:ribonuclease-3